MSILSLEFLGLTAATLVMYYVLPLKIRWWALLAASGVFVALSGWQGAAHLGAVALLSWGGALLLEKKKSRWILALCLTLILGSMIFIKYYPTVAQWLDGGLLKGSPLPVWEMIVPLGLSYFTFQTAGYLIDVYRRKAPAARNPLRTLLFAGYFLQLPQGPISTWKELEGQLTRGNQLEPENLTAGFQLMLWGYFKKLVIADRLAPVTDALLDPAAFLNKTELGGTALPGWFVLGGVILYAIRLYADFSGGLDLVRGVSRMLGIKLPENFRRPFFSQTVAEYWRRWHITLGAWFRSNLLYPVVTSKAAMGLSRAASKVMSKKTARALPTALVTLLVFVLIGLWHGASWNAAVFGGYFGLLMAISLLLEPLWKLLARTLSLPKGGWMRPLRLIRTWILVLFAQYFAFTHSPEQGLGLLRQTFADWHFKHFVALCTGVMPGLEWLIAGIALAILLAVDLLCEWKNDWGDRLATTHFYVRWPLLLFLILAIAVFGCYGEGFDASAFVYTQF